MWGRRLDPGLTAGWRRDLALAAAVGAFFGLIGPFGNYMAGPLWQREIYWIGVVCLGAVVYGLPIRLMLRPQQPLRRLLPRAALLIAAVGAPFAFVISQLATWVWPRLAVFGPLDWYFEVLAISIPVVAAQIALSRALVRKGPPDQGPKPVDQPIAAPAEVLCLQMEDHYVRVHTPRGSHLILSTMGQAIARMGSVRGLRVHRSWWVAEQALQGAEQEGRNLRLRLTNGLVAPVARSSVAAVRSAGWLTARRDAA